MLLGPHSAKPSAAIFLLSTVVNVGLFNKYVTYGTINNITMPGTDIANAHNPQSKCTPNIFAMKSPASAFGAIAVRNIKDVTFVTMYVLTIKKRPALFAVSPGSEPKDFATEFMIGNTIPPQRAVLDGVAGEIIPSNKAVT